MVTIIGGPTPSHSADVAGDHERSSHARWRKNSFRPKLADFREARSTIGIIDAPDVVSAQRLRNQRTGSQWKRLCRRRYFAGNIGLRYRALLDSENRLARFPIQDEEIAGL